LKLLVEDDLGRTSEAIQLAPGDKKYLPAARTGTYKLTLTWTATGDQSTGVVNFGLIPGPLNSVMELVTSYVQGVSGTQTDTVWAYSDPDLPGIDPTNPTVGAADGAGAAKYWPLWSDPNYFSTTGKSYTPTDLADAYHKLVSALRDLKK